MRHLDIASPRFRSLHGHALLASLLLIATVANGATPDAKHGGADPSQVPLSDFLDPQSFGSLKISPDGAHYAATVPTEDRTALVVLRRSDNRHTAVVNVERRGHVVDFTWVNPRQVVFRIASKSGSREVPVLDPRLYIVDAESGESRPLHKQNWLTLQDDLRDEDDVVLVAHGASRRALGLSRLDLRTGKMKTFPANPPVNRVTMYSDGTGKLSMIRGYAEQESKPRHYALDEQGKWKLVNSEAESGETMDVIGFTADNRSAYLQVEQPTGPDALYRLDLQTLQRTRLMRDERVDVRSVIRSPITRAAIAVVFLDGKPRIEYLDPEDRHAKEIEKLVRAFPGSHVYPTSYTRDGREAIYYVTSDINPGEYYLVDHDSGKARFIAAGSEKLDPERMSPMQPFRFKARDGLEMEGFLTRPKSWPAGEAGPLVVMPHGGPKGIYDAWGYDSEVQLLASRGYAVLQLNFRGSGNYGKQFRDAGDREWGGKMQDDLTDATHWAIAQGHAAPGRICIYGASYGAYAAMMGLVREPDLYACGIGNVGVYDLRQLYREETLHYLGGQRYVDATIGKSNLETISPTHLASRIRVPVLLGAGEDDRTAPVSHTRTMHRALRTAGVPVDMVVYPNEGHGYYALANRTDWANRVLALLERTIGGGSAVQPPMAMTAAGEP